MTILNRRALVAGAAALGVAAPALAQARKIKVAAIYTVPVEQQWVSRIHKAINAAVARGEAEYAWSENVSNSDYERVMREYAQKGADLVVGEAFGVERAARKVAADFPKTSFLIGSSFGPSGRNFAVFDNWIQEPAYLTGLIAGGMTKSGVIGLVGGYPIPEVNRLMHAFMDGARETNKNVRFMVTFIGSWFDPPKAKEAAFAMIDRAIEKVRDGSFTAEDYGQFSTMKFGGASLAPLGTFEDKVPAEIKALVKTREAEIREGMYRVNVNDSEPRSSM